MNLNEFRNPSAIYRNAPFWSWNEKLSKEELERQIDIMTEKGWGGYFLHSRVGLVTGYLSDEWMKLIRACAEKARETKTYAWLYDEDKWPSGFAGGEVAEKDEKHRARALVLLKKGEETENDTVLAKTTNGGVEYSICKRVQPLGSLEFNGSTYVDLMNPDTVREFINCTHERYKKVVGEYFGKEIPGIFTDEPCYLMKRLFQGLAVIPWSDCLPDYFRKIKGYSIEDKLEELFFETGDYKKTRFDFYDAATRLFMESFTKQYQSWCRENNLLMTGHFMAEDNPVYALEWIGSAMPHYEYMDWPGIDKLQRHIEQHVTVKQLTSVTDQLNKERALCEVFGCIGQQSSFFERKWIGDWQAVLGINFVNSHLSLYSMRGERKRDYPANIYYQQPWWDDERKYADYTARLCYLVKQGKREVDILVVHPGESVWCEFSPLHEKDGYKNEKNEYCKPFDELTYKLMANKLDYHLGDEIIMEGHGRVTGKKLAVGRHEYSTVIVPPSLTLRSNTVKLLCEFAKVAGPDKIIFIGKIPDRVDGILDQSWVPEGVKVVNTIDEAINIVDAYYPERIRVTDKKTGKNAEKVLLHSRIDGENRIVFAANTDEKNDAHVTITFPGTKIPYVLDLMNAKIYRPKADICEGKTRINLTFMPAGSVAFYFTDEDLGDNPVPELLDMGVEFDANSDEGYNYLSYGEKSICTFDVEPLEENVLPLNYADLYLDGKPVALNTHLSAIWHDHFYKAPDGTPFKAVYRFMVHEVPEGDITAVIEVAENLDSVKINGVKVNPLKTRGEESCFDPQKCWKDVSFTKVPIGGNVVKGINTIEIEGIKVNNITGPNNHSRVKNFKDHIPTEVETVYIIGNFSVVNENNKSFAITKFEKPNVSGNVTISGMPFYAGRISLKTVINVQKPDSKRVYLRLNNVHAASVSLKVNGKYSDVKYWRPYLFDITDLVKNGENTIEIIAATTLFNLMGPNWIENVLDITFLRPTTFINKDSFTDRLILLPFGVESATVIVS